MIIGRRSRREQALLACGAQRPLEEEGTSRRGRSRNGAFRAMPERLSAVGGALPGSQPPLKIGFFAEFKQSPVAIGRWCRKRPLAL